MQSVSPITRRPARRSARILSQLSAVPLHSSRFHKNLPRVIRLRACLVVAGKRRQKRQRSPLSTSPNQELVTSPIGHVALGPWSGPYQMHPLVASSSSGEIPFTLFVDELGSSHFALDESTNAAIDTESAFAALQRPASPKYGQPTTATGEVNAVVFAGPMSGAAPLGLSHADKQEIKKKVEEAAQLQAVMWPPVPSRRCGRPPSYERAPTSRRSGHMTYHVQQPRGRNMS